MTGYHFKTQFADGLAYEAALDRFFGRWYTIRRVGRDLERIGIDRIFRDANNVLSTVQYKGDDAAARTGNFFVETVSVDTDQTPGWIYTTCANYFVHYIPSKARATVYETLKLRDAFQTVWSKLYPSRAVANLRDGQVAYHTHGVLVPLTVAEAIALKQFEVTT